MFVLSTKNLLKSKPLLVRRDGERVTVFAAATPTSSSLTRKPLLLLKEDVLTESWREVSRKLFPTAYFSGGSRRRNRSFYKNF